MQVALSSNTPTMSSLELVDFINSQRGEDEAVLQHKHFLDKVPQVLGEGCANFSATYTHHQNKQTYPCYNFPKREACLMAMSYSYELQAKVYDRMTELEAKQAPALPVTFAESLRQLADALDQKAVVEKERDEAIATKALIGGKREATAMATASSAIRRAQKLEVELDKSKQYATVKRMEMLYHGQKFDWRRLKSAGMDIGISAIDVFDANYGTVKAYHADVWIEAYALSIDTSNLLEFFSDD